MKAIMFIFVLILIVLILPSLFATPPSDPTDYKWSGAGDEMWENKENKYSHLYDEEE